MSCTEVGLNTNKLFLIAGVNIYVIKMYVGYVLIFIKNKIFVQYDHLNRRFHPRDDFMLRSLDLLFAWLTQKHKVRIMCLCLMEKQ